VIPNGDWNTVGTTIAVAQSVWQRSGPSPAAPVTAAGKDTTANSNVDRKNRRIVISFLL
jgi:hypothetical protein